MTKYAFILWLVGLTTPLLAQTTPDSLQTPTKSDQYQNGSYLGESKGFCGNVCVCVTVKKHRVDKVEVVKHSENRPLNAIEFVPRKIKKAATVDEVECVTGASITSNAIKNAVKNALTKASVKPE